MVFNVFAPTVLTSIRFKQINCCLVSLAMYNYIGTIMCGLFALRITCT